jgi:hypothetical protein
VAPQVFPDGTPVANLSGMRIIPSLSSILITCAFALNLSTRAVTLQELRNTPDLTPSTFASHFSNFDFCFRAEIQSPDVFLATQSGDCDDYSTLAADVLREKGYSPRLVTIRMPKVVHVVCYIEETGAYLDYNVRAESTRLVKCESSLDAIAASVARSYGTKWTSVSEFTFSQGTKRLVSTVLPGKTDKNNARRFASLFR